VRDAEAAPGRLAGDQTRKNRNNAFVGPAQR
jgi:hypothetical protein